MDSLFRDPRESTRIVFRGIERKHALIRLGKRNARSAMKNAR
jgi:hypothetical protein